MPGEVLAADVVIATDVIVTRGHSKKTDGSLCWSEVPCLLQTGASDASFQTAMGYATAKRAFSFQDFDRAHTFGPSHTAGF